MTKHYDRKVFGKIWYGGLKDKVGPKKYLVEFVYKVKAAAMALR